MNRKQILRKKIEESGVQSLSDAELLEFLLSHSGAEEGTAKLLLSKFRSIKAAADAVPGLLMSQYGLSVNTAALLKLIPALCHEKSANRKAGRLINNTAKAKKYFENFFIGYSVEYFSAAAINDGMWVAGCFANTSGSSSEVSVRCRDIVRFAVTSGKDKLIIAHNHPDGNPDPSESDLIATRKIIAALRPLDIKVLDHIIVGKESSLSLREMPGLIGFEDAPEYKVVT